MWVCIIYGYAVLMDWIETWNAGIIPWHNNEVAGSVVLLFIYSRDTMHLRSALVKYIEQLTEGNKHARILVPLCGKSVDMKW